jgi:hypothetical protein
MLRHVVRVVPLNLQGSQRGPSEGNREPCPDREVASDMTDMLPAIFTEPRAAGPRGGGSASALLPHSGPSVPAAFLSAESYGAKVSRCAAGPPQGGNGIGTQECK